MILIPGFTFDGAMIAHQLQTTLPAYAVPVFMRIRDTQDTTGTFKYQKGQLKKDGFDLQTITEPVYVLTDKKLGYVPLTPELHGKIISGVVRP